MNDETHAALSKLATEIGGTLQNGALCCGTPEHRVFVYPVHDNIFMIESEKPIFEIARGKVLRVHQGEGEPFYLGVPLNHVPQTVALALNPPATVEDEIEFPYECMLRDHCAKDLSVVEDGLKLYGESRLNGVEFKVFDSESWGSIDVLAVDRNGDLVVIEFKLAHASHQVVEQVLYYINSLRKKLPPGVAPETRVRGIIVAREISETLRTAAKSHPDIKLMKYISTFAIAPV